MSLPQVISENPTELQAEVLAQYQLLCEQNGLPKELYDAQSDRLLLDLYIYRETLTRAAINDAARQNLVKYARLPMLEILGNDDGVPRLPAQSARTTLRFSHSLLVATETTLPAGFRVLGPKESVWATTHQIIIPAGLGAYAEVRGLAELTGPDYNGFITDTITEGFDPLPTGVSVTNTTITGGGADIEDAERYRERIILSKSRASAGANDAFMFIAKTADIRVIDVSVQVVSEGWVRVIVLTDGDPVEVVAAVDKALQADNKRPLTDKVDTLAATPVAVNFDAEITPLTTTTLTTLQTQVEAALNALKTQLKRTLGYDSVSSQINAALQNLPGVKRVVLSGAEQAIALNEYAVLSWNVSYAEAEGV